MCLAGSHAVAQIQGYHLAYIWGSLLKFQGVEVGLKFDVFLHFLHYGGGVVPKSMPCARLWFAKFCVWAYPCLSKLSVFVKLRRGLCLAGCHVVVQT